MHDYDIHVTRRNKIKEQIMLTVDCNSRMLMSFPSTPIKLYCCSYNWCSSFTVLNIPTVKCEKANNRGN